MKKRRLGRACYLQAQLSPMDKLRVPFFVVAVIALLLVVGIELGTSLLPPPKVDPAEFRQTLQAQNKDEPLPDVDSLLRARGKYPPKPGLGIPYLALIDGVLLWMVGLAASGLIIPARILGRIQGIATLIFSLLLILAGIVLVFAAFTLLMVMLGLFLSLPFGTIAYLAIWGFFNRGGASATLGLIFFLKLVFIVFLLLAQQRFIQNKGLVFLALVSLLGNVIVSFLHGLVPIILVSLTDAIAAIVVGIIGLILLVVVFLGSIKSVVKAISLKA